MPVTPRTLDAMLRLTVAHAKCRLSPIATEDDARAALEIMSYALYHEVSTDSKSSMGVKDESDEELEIDLSSDDESTSTTKQQVSEINQSVGKKRKRESDDEDMPQAKRARMNSGAVDVSSSIQLESSSLSIASERAEEFGKLLVRYMTSRHLSECNLNELCTKVNALNPSKTFQNSEALAAVKYLEQKEKLLLRDGTVHLF